MASNVSDHYYAESRRSQLRLESPLWVISRHFAMRERCPLYPQKRTSAAYSIIDLLETQR